MPNEAHDGDTRRQVAIFLFIVALLWAVGFLLFCWFFRDGIMEDGLGPMSGTTHGVRALIRTERQMRGLWPSTVSMSLVFFSGLLIYPKRR